jgi:poly-gamma-glutamate synthesis protein (capsule biosynthesis protein)
MATGVAAAGDRRGAAWLRRRRRFLQMAAGLAGGLMSGGAAADTAAAVAEGGTRPADRPVTLFLCGDVMTGRGIDQILPHPGDARLCERYVTSAQEYVELAETANGPIPRAADFAYVWGDALHELDRRRPDARIINLETSVTRSRRCLPKGINYKMAPENAPCLTAAGIDCCVLANNHVLDWGRDGLLDTLATLDRLGIATAGAGADRERAEAPAVMALGTGGRVLVFAFGLRTSGIPRDWAAAPDAPGVNLLDDASDRTLERVSARIRAARQPGDVVVASIHWGGNWGYRIASDERRLAHGLIEAAGVDVVHGHSSHHPKAIEVHRGKLVLYGCGDFLNDYEGISGYEEYRDDLAVMYLPALRATDGTLQRLDMVAFQIRNFRLGRASRQDTAWLRDTLSREGERFGTALRLRDDDTLELAWR